VRSPRSTVADGNQVDRSGDGLDTHRREKTFSHLVGILSRRLSHNGQLGSSDHDDLYWNVTGNDWSFAIERRLSV
jgi:hypothetical protein